MGVLLPLFFILLNSIAWTLGTNLSNEVAKEGSTSNGIEAKMAPFIGEAVIERSTGEVAVVLDRLTQQLKGIRDDYQWWRWIPVYYRAVKASRNNWDKARRLQLLPNTQVLSELFKFYEHTADKASPSLTDITGTIDRFTRKVHEQARDYIFQAYSEIKALHNEVISGDMQLVQIFYLQPLANGCETGLDVKYKSGYQTTKTIEAALHTKIATSAGINAEKFLTQASVSPEVATEIRASASFSNSVETEKSYYLKLTDCKTGVYVYQTKFNNKLGDDSTLSVWGVGVMICSTPLCSK